ncbi:MAG: hypothetical protein HQL46_13820 [Gammaproteobacteria bacterium]|nr:hypothetical protein [Gammaproteobacteria bacterium]
MKVIKILICFIILSGCSVSNNPQLVKQALVTQENFNRLIFENYELNESLIFNTEVWTKTLNFNNNRIAIIYIEGDGNAWSSRYEQSADPSPQRPLALKLAAKDPRNNIFYFSRPCQYVSIKDSLCQNSKKYWGTARYNEMVIKYYHQLISLIKKRYNINKFELIGYSGGGVIAAAVAALRKDIILLTTVASNLDHQRWTTFHNVSKLTESIDLYQFSKQLSKIRQIHLFGETDNIVPAKINTFFLRNLKQKQPGNVKVLILSHGHQCCWVDNWKNILKEINDS